MKSAVIKTLASLAFLATSTAAIAGPVVGVAVSDPTSTTEVGTANSNGVIYFYIPLTDVAEDYGVGGGGTSSDTCSTYAGTCTGGSLNMTLYFDTVESGEQTVRIDFRDLDAAGVNDPWFLLEALEVYDEDGNLIATIDAASDLLAGSNANSQAIEFNVTADGAFFIQLAFDSSFDPNAPHGWYRNTAEALLATVEAMEPATIAIFGLGLLVLFARRRKTRPTNAAAA